MKLSFHASPEEAQAHAIAVFQAEGEAFGQPATFNQIDALLIWLNGEEAARLLDALPQAGREVQP
jgi:hypothetical protein